MSSRRSTDYSLRVMGLGSALWMCHCGTAEEVARGEFDESRSADATQQIPAIPPLGPVTIAEDCPGLRSSLDDPDVQELAREHELELDRVLARATGEFRSTLRWPATDGDVSVAPESGDVPLTIRVSYGGGAATYFDGVEEGDPPGTEVPGCPDHVEVQMSVEVQTDGGALNERFDAVLVMEHRLGAIRYRAPLRSLGGRLSLQAPPPRGSTQVVLGPELDFFLQVSELGTSGSLAVIAREFTDGIETTRVATDALPLRRFAAWPAVNDCSGPQRVAPIDRSIDGVSPARIAQLVAAQRVPFRWADGTESTLVLSPRPSAPTGCAQEDRGLFHWWFDADLTAVTADGILNGPISGAAHLVQYRDRVTAVFEMSNSFSRDALVALLPTSAVAPNYDGGYVDFTASHTFAWPSEQLIGSEGNLSIAAAPPACDLEECDEWVTLAEGRMPESAAPPEPTE